MKYLLTPDEAKLVRWIAENDGPPAEALYSWRIFLPPLAKGGPETDEPIRVVEATGKARCRACGEQLAQGEPVVVFGFDSRAEPDLPAPGAWGRLQRAYLHREEQQCRPQPTSADS